MESLYSFGYGLSYTSFTYGQVSVDHEKIAAIDTVTLSVDVSNSGRMASDEVVQLDLTHPGVDGAPLRALRGFSRVHLDRGEKKTVKSCFTTAIWESSMRKGSIVSFPET